MAGTVVDQVVQAAVKIIEQALLLSEVDPAMQLEVWGVRVVEEHSGAIVGEEPHSAGGGAKSLAVLAVERGVKGEGVAGGGGLRYICGCHLNTLHDLVWVAVAGAHFSQELSSAIFSTTRLKARMS